MTQIKKSGLENNSVDETKVRLNNDSALRAKDFLGLDVDVLKVDVDDYLRFLIKPISFIVPSADEDLANVLYVKNYADTKQSLSEKGQPLGYAPLDAGGLIPSVHLPSFVDDVLEFTTLSALPVTGEAGKIYVTLDDNLTYRWTGSMYLKIGQEVTQLELDNGLANTLVTANNNSIINALIFG